MRLSLKFNDNTYELHLEEPDSPCASAKGATCPACKAALVVRGTGKRPGTDDRSYEANAVSVCCESDVGLIVADVDTIFGVREDRAVLEFGRARVY